MNDARFVGGGESVGQLHRNVECGRHRRETIRQQGAKRATAHQLHHDVRDVILTANPVDGDDVRMVETGGSPRFLFEPFDERAVSGNRPDDLERHLTLETHLFRAINLPHPADAEQCERFVSLDPHGIAFAQAL